MTSKTSSSSRWSNWLFPFILFCFAGAFSLYPPFDPDLPWHLKVGGQILNGHFPFADTFSHTMPGYRWVDHEWLTDAIMALLHGIGGYFLLAVPFILAFWAAFALSVRTGRLLIGTRTPNRLFEAALGIWGLVTVNSVLGTRPQVLSLLGFSLVLNILVEYLLQKGNKIRWLPLIMLIWANLHGGYVIGLVLIALVCLAECSSWFIQRLGLTKLEVGERTPAQVVRPLVESVTLSILAVCINPYGPGILYETFRTALDPYARSHIMEWLPVAITRTTGLMVYIMLGFFFVGALARKVTLPFFSYILLLPMVYLGLSSYRHIPLLVLTLLPLLYLVYGQVEPVAEFFSRGYRRVFAWKGQFLHVLLNFSLIMCLGGLLGVRATEFVVYSLYQHERDQVAEAPALAVQYLVDHPRAGEIYNHYGWGGYLISNMPDTRVFIDGRMASWQSGDEHILKSYYAIGLVQEGWQQKLSDYGVTRTLTTPDVPLVGALALLPDWREVYRDDIAVIFEKNHEP